MTDHSILCPAFVGTLDRLAGTGASGPCECGVEAPAPLPVHEDVVSEPEQSVAQPPQEFKCRSCGEKHAASFVSTNDVSICRWCSGEEGDDEPKVIETACADSRPVEPVVGVQAELPFDPEPLVESAPADKIAKPCGKPKAPAPIGFVFADGQGNQDPNGGYMASAASPSAAPCVACGGSGRSSKGGSCSPCGGSGKRGAVLLPAAEQVIAPESKASGSAGASTKIEAEQVSKATTQEHDPGKLSEPEKPRRKRRKVALGLIRHPDLIGPV